MNKSDANPEIKFVERGRWGWIILFASSTTLICCALPIVLVALGLGAVSASLFSTLPFLVALAHYKLAIFTGSGALLALAAWAVFRPNRSCPTDPKLSAICEQTHRFNQRMLFLSAAVWGIGFAAAYLALPLWSLINSR